MERRDRERVMVSPRYAKEERERGERERKEERERVVSPREVQRLSLTHSGEKLRVRKSGGYTATPRSQNQSPR